MVVDFVYLKLFKTRLMSLLGLNQLKHLSILLSFDISLCHCFRIYFIFQ